MKAYKIKKTLVQEYVSFGRNREEAIANFDYSQGYDFEGVDINGETFTNGEVLESKTTATSLGKNNLIIFHAKDEVFANAIWLKNHDDTILIRGYNNETYSVVSKPVTDETRKEKVIEIANSYNRISERY